MSIYQFESSNAKQEVVGSILAAEARLRESAEVKKGANVIGSGLVPLVVVFGCLRLLSFCSPGTFAGFDFGFPYEVTMALGPHQPNGLLVRCNRRHTPVSPFRAFCAGYKVAPKLGPLERLCSVCPQTPC